MLLYLARFSCFIVILSDQILVLLLQSSPNPKDKSKLLARLQSSSKDQVMSSVIHCVDEVCEPYFSYTWIQFSEIHNRMWIFYQEISLVYNARIYLQCEAVCFAFFVYVFFVSLLRILYALLIASSVGAGILPNTKRTKTDRAKIPSNCKWNNWDNQK